MTQTDSPAMKLAGLRSAREWRSNGGAYSPSDNGWRSRTMLFSRSSRTWV
jgi:hypothetical protein